MTMVFSLMVRLGAAESAPVQHTDTPSHWGVTPSSGESSVEVCSSWTTRLSQQIWCCSGWDAQTMNPSDVCVGGRWRTMTTYECDVCLTSSHPSVRRVRSGEVLHHPTMCMLFLRCTLERTHRSVGGVAVGYWSSYEQQLQDQMKGDTLSPRGDGAEEKLGCLIGDEWLRGLMLPESAYRRRAGW